MLGKHDAGEFFPRLIDPRSGHDNGRPARQQLFDDRTGDRIRGCAGHNGHIIPIWFLGLTCSLGGNPLQHFGLFRLPLGPPPGLAGNHVTQTSETA